MLAGLLLVVGCSSGGSGSSTTQPPADLNQAPVALADVQAASGGPLAIDVLGNDYDPDGGTVAIVSVAQPANGVSTVENAGTPADPSDDFVLYTPSAGYVGADGFAYTISDGASGRATGYVEITPMPAVIASDKFVSTSADTPVSVDLIAATESSIATLSQPAFGVVTIDDNGTPSDPHDDFVVYSPMSGYTGRDTFFYTLSTASGSDTAAVNVEVSDTPAATAPPNVHGQAAKGLLRNAQVEVFRVGPGGHRVGLPIAATTTDDQGRWSLSLPTPRPTLLVVTRSGSYADETRPPPRREIDLGDETQLYTVLRSDDDFAVVSIYTTALYLRARHAAGGVNFTATFEAVLANSTAVWGMNLAITPAADPAAPNATLPQSHRMHAMALGGVASVLDRVLSHLGIATPGARTLDAVARDLSDCRLDGRDFAGPISLEVRGVDRALPVDLDLDSEILRFRNNNFAAYSTTPLVARAPATCAVVSPPPDLEPPLVTVATRRVSSASPELSGFVDDPEAVVTVTVDGASYPAANLGGYWRTAAGTIAPPLADGIYDVAVRATDGAGNIGTDASTGELAIDVSAPALTIDAVTGVDGAPALTGSIDDPTATVTVSVAGMSYPAVLSGFNWSIAAGTITPALTEGAHEVTITAVDVLGNTAILSSPVGITVSGNTPPTFTISGDIAVAENFVGARIVTVAPDPVPAGEETQPVTYTLNPPASDLADVTIDASTGTVFLTALPDRSGVQSFTIIADDGQSSANFAAQTFMLSVTAVNNPPAFSVSGDIVESQDFVGTRAVAVTPLPVPADETDQVVTYTLSPASVPFANVVFDPASGAVSFTSLPGATGSQLFTVTADDGQAVNNVATNTFTLTVSPTATGNVAPVVTGQLALETPEEQPLALALADLTVTDPDNDYPADFTLSVQPGASYNVIGNTITPAKNFTGTLTVPVTVFDGASSSALFDVAIAVKPVNDAPSFALTGDVAETEDFSGSRIIDAVPGPVPADEIAQPVTYSLSPASVGFANVSLDPSTGAVTVTAIADEFGSQVFTLVADDGQDVNNTASQNFTVSVSSVNDAPAFSVSGDINEAEDFSGPRQVLVTPAPVPTNESSQTVTYSLSPAGVGFADVSLDAATGTVTITAYPDQSGAQLFTLTADDGQALNYSAVQTFTVAIAAENDTPTTSGLGDVTVVEDAAPMAIDLFAAFDDVEDSDAALAYSIVGNTNPALFDSLFIDSVDGTLTLDFAADTQGSGDLTVRATDTGGATVDASFIVTINPLADLAVAILPSTTSPGIGLEMEFTVELSHSGPSTATGVVVAVPLPAGYAFVDDDSGGEYNPSTGLWSLSTVASNQTIVLTVEVNPAGSYDVTAEVQAVNEPDPDSSPGNGNPAEDDQASTTTTPLPVADLGVQITVDDPIPPPDSAVVLTVTATNMGPFDATGIVIDLPPLPGQLTYESAAPSAGAFDLATGEWTGLAIAWSGDPAVPYSATLEVTARVDGDVPTTTVLESTASLAGHDQVDPDPVEQDSVAILVLDEGVKHGWVGGAGPDPTDWHNPANWDTGVVPITGDDVIVPATAFDPVLNADALTLASVQVKSGAQLALNGFTLSTVGSLDASAGPVAGPGVVRVEFGTIRGTVPELEVSLATSSSEAEAKGDIVVNGNLTLNQGRLDVNDDTITVNGDLLSNGNGILMQRSGAAEVVVNGDATFSGGDYAQLVSGKVPLRDGVMYVAGDFTQSGHPHSFAAEDKHLVVLNGSTPQTVYFQNPDRSNPDPDEPALSGSRFANLQIDKDWKSDGAVTLLSDVVVLRKLEQPLGGVPRIVAAPGSGYELHLGGADIDTAPFPQTENMVLDNVPVNVFQSANLDHLEGLTFTNMDPTVTQLYIERRAFDGPKELFDLRFETLPDFSAGGRYLVLNHTNTDPLKNLTIDIRQSTPLYGAPMTDTIGNATILWGGGTEDTDRDGISDTDEYGFGTNPVFADSDGDGSADPDELINGTDPFASDTDGDGIGDGAEIVAGGDPLIAAAPGTILYVRPAPLGDDANSGFGGWTDALATNAAVEAALTDGAGIGQPFYVLYDAGVYGPLVIDTHANVSIIGSVGPGTDVPTHPATTIFDASSVPDTAVLSLVDSSAVSLQSLELRGAVNDGSKLGGGLFVNDASSVVASDLRIEDNVATEAGAGIFVDDGGVLAIERSLIRRNVVPEGGAGGGGIFSYGSLTMTESVVADNRFEGNAGGGGGVYIELLSGPVTLRDNLVIANLSASSGGGLMVFDASFSLTLFNNLLVGNANDAALGGALYGDRLDRGAPILVESNSVAFNRSLSDDKSGAGLHLERANDVELRDNVLWYNVDADTIDELQDQFFDDGDRALIEYNSLEDFGGADVDFNNEDNPRFERGFYLRSDSSVDDEGSRTASDAGLGAPYTTKVDGTGDVGILDRGYHYRRGADGLPYGVSVIGEYADCATDTVTLQFVIAAQGGELGTGHVVAVRRDGDDTAGGTLVTRTGIEPYGWSNSQLAIDEGDGAYRFDVVGVAHGSNEIAVYELKIDDGLVLLLNSSDLTTLFGAAGC